MADNNGLDYSFESTGGGFRVKSAVNSGDFVARVTRDVHTVSWSAQRAQRLSPAASSAPSIVVAPPSNALRRSPTRVAPRLSLSPAAASSIVVAPPAASNALHLSLSPAAASFRSPTCYSAPNQPSYDQTPQRFLSPVYRSENRAASVGNLMKHGGASLLLSAQATARDGTPFGDLSGDQWRGVMRSAVPITPPLLTEADLDAWASALLAETDDEKTQRLNALLAAELPHSIVLFSTPPFEFETSRVDELSERVSVIVIGESTEPPPRRVTRSQVKH